MDQLLKQGTAGNQDQFYIDVANDAAGWAYTEYFLQYLREHNIKWDRISPIRRTIIAEMTRFNFQLAHIGEYGITKENIGPPFSNVPSILDQKTITK